MYAWVPEIIENNAFKKYRIFIISFIVSIILYYLYAHTVYSFNTIKKILHV